MECRATKNSLKRKGYTQAEAAERLGVSRAHLNRVLNGERQSAALMAKIEALPQRKVVEIN